VLLKSLNVGHIHTNCYVLACERTRQALVIDPGGDLPLIEAALVEFDAHAVLIALTHYHFDHVLAADALRHSTGAPIAIGRAEVDLLATPPALFRFFREEREALVADRGLDDGEELPVGDLRVHVIATPGHSPGGLSLYLAEEQAVFCGDALFRGSVGRTDLPGSDEALLLRSIRERLFTLPDETVAYPGHGPQTTIGYERRHNPWAAPSAP
jgi:glyoxylase-like metal-dependent hydrolase (beta-lactamase superfamily II)